MASRDLTVLTITVDAASLALVEQCAHALAENDLPYLVDEMCAAGSFREQVRVTPDGHGGLVVALGDMTELVLYECIAIAIRRDWGHERKAKWLRAVMVLAGVMREDPKTT
jgi:hypothetical protein